MREIIFVLPFDKPNGLTVQDDLFKEYEPVLAFFEGVNLQKANYIQNGWFNNRNTGVLYFDAYGGLADGTLTLLCNKI